MLSSLALLIDGEKNALVGIHILPNKLAACIQLKGIKTENQIKAELVF